MKKEFEKNSGKRIRIVAGSLLTAFSVLLTANCAMVMLRKIKKVANPRIYKKNFLADLMLTATLFISGLDLIFGFFTRFKKTWLNVFGWINRILFGFLSGVILFFFGKTVIGSLIRTRKHAKYAVVPGMALEDGKPAKDLLYRVETAAEYAKENPAAVLILTGGVPDFTGRTEAKVMRDLLLERGVPEDRMILEDQSDSTKQNFRNSLEIVDSMEAIVVITSNYHMNRAVRIAKKAGFKNVHRHPAPSSIFPYPSNVMWEVLHGINEYTKIVKDT